MQDAKLTGHPGRPRTTRLRSLSVTVLLGAMLVAAAPNAGAVKWDKPVREAVATTAPAVQAPPASTAAVSASALGTAEFTLGFAPCADGFECARVSIPADHSQPGGQRIELRIARRPAEDAAARVGPLYVNPGGPGGSAFSLGRAIARSQRPFYAELRRRFDLVTIEPRAVAGTTVSCPIRRSADRCDAASNALLPFVDSASAARDHEAVRRLLGPDRVAFLGYSWGSLLGAQWTSLFPGGLRAVILDGAVDSDALDPLASLEKVTALDNGLRFFLETCAAEGSGCPFNDGTDLGARFDAVLASVRAGELVGPGTLTWDLDDFEGVVALGLESPRAFRVELARSLDVAARTKNGGALFTLFREITGGGEGDATTTDRSAFLAYACRDGLVASARPDVQRPYDRSKPTRFITFAESFVNDRQCRGYPLPALAKPRFAGTAGTPVLVAGNRHDWRTPLPWAQRLANQLGAPLLTYEGLGHTIVGKGLPCADDPALRLLVEGVLPASLSCAVPPPTDVAAPAPTTPAAPPTVPPVTTPPVPLPAVPVIPVVPVVPVTPAGVAPA